MKDRLTHVASGTYTLSGWRMQQFSDSLHPIDSVRVLNAQIEISKHDKDEINVNFHLPFAFDATLKEREASNDVYFFDGLTNAPLFPNGAFLFFIKKDLDSVYVHYDVQTDSVTIYDYILSGRKN